MLNLIKNLNYLIIASFVFGALVSCEGMKESTKKHSPQDTATYKSGDLEIAISYSKPYKNGRLIFGSKEDDALVPYGVLWRTGANEATQIKLNKDIEIGGQKLPAGTYTIYTIPGPDNWILAINSRTDYWGKTLFGSPFNEDDDVMRVTGSVKELTEPLEQFTIDFIEESEIAYLRLLWDQTEVRFAFTP